MDDQRIPQVTLLVPDISGGLVSSKRAGPSRNGARRSKFWWARYARMTSYADMICIMLLLLLIACCCCCCCCCLRLSLSLCLAGSLCPSVCLRDCLYLPTYVCVATSLSICPPDSWSGSLLVYLSSYLYLSIYIYIDVSLSLSLCTALVAAPYDCVACTLARILFCECKLKQVSLCLCLRRFLYYIHIYIYICIVYTHMLIGC